MRDRKFLNRDQWAAWAKNQPAQVDPMQVPLIRKNLTCEIVECDSDPATGMMDLEFVLSTAAVDREHDIIEVEVWTTDNFEKNPVVLWAHSYGQPPVGKAIKTWSDDGALRGRVRFTPRDMNPFGHMIYQMVQGGFLNAVSVGFQPHEYVFNDEHGGYDFKVQDLLEFSIVPVPANPEALIAASVDAGIDLAPMQEWAKGILDGLDEDDPLDLGEPDSLDGMGPMIRAMGGSSVAPTHIETGTSEPPAAMYCQVVSDSPSAVEGEQSSDGTWTYTTGDQTFESPPTRWYDGTTGDPIDAPFVTPDYKIDWDSFKLNFGPQLDNEMEGPMKEVIEALTAAVQSLEVVVAGMPDAVKEAVVEAIPKTEPVADPVVDPEPDPVPDPAADPVELSDDEERQLIVDAVKEHMTSVNGRLPD